MRGADPRPAKCLWKQRNCLLPARLWYRVELDVEVASSPPLSGRSLADDRTQDWRLEGNGAVRLTLECVDLSDFNPEPFLVKRRINGERRAIGGCGRKPRDGLRPTVHFAALAGGSVTSFEINSSFGPFANERFECPGYDWRVELIGTQGLTGQISTPSSLSEGLFVTLSLAEPEGTVLFGSSEEQCMVFETGETFTAGVPAFEGGFPHSELLGETARHWLAVGNDVTPWTELWKLIRFPLNAADFGGRYRITRTTGQSLRDPMPRPFPPFGTFRPHRQQYTYTVRLEPCPRKGLDVERC
jgi:hypothetical protein